MLAVALHDVEPATFERCALIRDWLDDHGVARVTLLVIPAPHLHPFPARSPELATGCSTAQRRRRRDRPARPPAPPAARPGRSRGRCRRWQGGAAAEFAGLDAGGRRGVGRGRPARARARRARAARVRRARLRVHARAARRAGRAASSGGRRCCGVRRPPRRARPRALARHVERAQARRVAAVVRAGAALSAALLRLDLHPADFDHPRHVAALDACCAARAATAWRSPTTTWLSVQAEAVPAQPTGARACAATARPTPSPAPRRGATGTSGTGTRASTQSPGRTSTPTARAPSCARSCAPGARTGSSRTRRSGRPRPRWRRAPLYATASFRGDTATESIQTPLLAFAWERVGARGDPASRRGARARSRPTPTGSIRERDPDDDGLITILLPDESGLDDSPKYDAGLRRARALAAGLLAARRSAAAGSGWSAGDARPHHRRARRGRAGQRRPRAFAAARWRRLTGDGDAWADARRAHARRRCSSAAGTTSAASSSTSPAGASGP